MESVDKPYNGATSPMPDMDKLLVSQTLKNQTSLVFIVPRLVRALNLKFKV